jgi:hypothetical protein
VRRRERTEEEQARAIEETGVRHRRGERERAEGEHPCRGCEPAEDLRERRRAGDAPGRRERDGDDEVGERLEEPRDRGAEQHQHRVPRAFVKPRGRRELPERERQRDRGRRPEDRPPAASGGRATLDGERPRLDRGSRQTQQLALPLLETLGDARRDGQPDVGPLSHELLEAVARETPEDAVARRARRRGAPGQQQPELAEVGPAIHGADLDVLLGPHRERDPAALHEVQSIGRIALPEQRLSPRDRELFQRAREARDGHAVQVTEERDAPQELVVGETVFDRGTLPRPARPRPLRV